MQGCGYQEVGLIPGHPMGCLSQLVTWGSVGSRDDGTARVYQADCVCSPRWAIHILHSLMLYFQLVSCKPKCRAGPDR